MFFSLIPGLGMLFFIVMLILTVVGTFRCRTPQQSKLSQTTTPAQPSQIALTQVVV